MGPKGHIHRLCLDALHINFTTKRCELWNSYIFICLQQTLIPNKEQIQQCTAHLQNLPLGLYINAFIAFLNAKQLYINAICKNKDGYCHQKLQSFAK